MSSSSNSSIGCCRAGLRLQLLQLQLLLHEIQTKWWRALAASDTPLPPSSPLYAFLYLSVLRQLLMWPNKKLNVLASLAHPTRRQAISAHSYYSLSLPLPLPLYLSLSLCCPLSASLCGISSQADGGGASPAQSQLQLSTSSKLQQFYVPKVACNLFVVTHTHTHICTHLQHTHPHAHMCKGALDSFN